MQLEAIYDHGRLEFPQPIRFAHERFPVVIEFPDSEIIDEENLQESEQPAALATHVGTKLRAEIRQILGSFSRQRPTVSVEEEKAADVGRLEEECSP